jgi:galactosyltransferase
MSKPLLALFTCHDYVYKAGRKVSAYPVRPKTDRRAPIKATWLKDVDIPYKWFFGSSPEGQFPQEDEVFLDCPDDYHSLPYKTRAIAQWAVANGYDRIIKVDDDTYIHWDRFRTRPLLSDPDIEYSGTCWAWDTPGYAYGGCYVLAGKMLQAVANAEIKEHITVEDAWVGGVAINNGIRFVNDKSIFYGHVHPHTNVQYVENSLLRDGHDYSVLNPLDYAQMVFEYTKDKP